MARLPPPGTAQHRPSSLERAILDAGGVARAARQGALAHRGEGAPRAFLFVTSGQLSVQFRTRERQVPWAECRAAEGQDCLPVTAAILSDRAIAVRAVCLAPAQWLELPPRALLRLMHRDAAFRNALFAGHARRLPSVLARISMTSAVALDQRIADWLLSHAQDQEVRATHAEIAAQVLTAREVVSRKLKRFASKGWIVQGRGCIRIEAPAALSRVARDAFSIRARVREREFAPRPVEDRGREGRNIPVL